ncbi:MAG: amidohydrolase family protein [Bacteroidetes bacterium]|nr:MAG: amidohydrolase family protein [Bacteroidota bacterium]
MNHPFILPLLFFLFHHTIAAQVSESPTLLLRPDRVFDGNTMHQNWSVLVEGAYIRAAGPENSIRIPTGTRILELTDMTVLPGLIEGHSHVLLHPYNETSWNDQVLVESEAERVIRATGHLRATLEAGFTTIRDLGSEGAGYADVGIKTAVEKGLIPGPRMLVAGPAIVASGSYGPKGFAPHVQVPKGAEEADGVEQLQKVARIQIGNGADIVKVYADYRWGPDGTAKPTFTLEELQAVVRTASSSGRPVVAHAATPEGIRRSVLAGVETIEHGDGADSTLFVLMADREVAWCPTLAAAEAILEYRGWRKGVDPEPERIRVKKQAFRMALQSGVTICAGGDAGVFSHGDNARELELMVEYGMTPVQALKAATSVNARVFHLEDKLGSIRAGMLADIIAVRGNPAADIHALRQVELVLKNGQQYK